MSTLALKIQTVEVLPHEDDLSVATLLALVPVIFGVNLAPGPMTDRSSLLTDGWYAGMVKGR